jgi:hypothetical protein
LTRIGLDLDGVVYPWSPSVRKLLQQERGYPDIGESTYWNYVKDQIEPKDWKWLWTRGVESMFGIGRAYPGTVKPMQEMGKSHDLVIITHRPKAAVPVTLAWLAGYRAHPSSVHVLDHTVPKSTVQPQCDVYVDDKPEVCEDLLQNTSANVYMPYRLWNEGWEPPARFRSRFFRYNKLDEVLDCLG